MEASNVVFLTEDARRQWLTSWVAERACTSEGSTDTMSEEW
jgi:hypothetical protein